MRWHSVRSPSLALRLALTLAISLVVITTAYLLMRSVVVERFSDFLVLQSLKGQATDIAEGIRINPATGQVSVALEPADAFGFDAYYANLQYRVLSSKGEVLASSIDRLNTLLPGVALDKQSDFYTRVMVDDIDFHVFATQHRTASDVFIIQLGRSDGFARLANEAITPAVAESIGFVALIAVLTMSTLGYLSIRSVLGPIRAVSRTARSLDQNNLSARLPDRELPAEIKPLIVAFNGVLDRLESSFSSQQRFFANAAHELKTPIALLRAQLETGPVKVSDQVLQGVDSIGRAVNQLLHMAEISGGRPRRLQPVVVADIAQQAARFLSWRAERSAVTIHIKEVNATDIQLQADPGELFVLFKNVLENAVDFSPAGGAIIVRIAPDAFEIEDQGPGVPLEQRDKVFDRFWRGGQTDRAGSGLGLAICREIAQAHGWRISCTGADSGGTVLGVSTS